MKSFALKPKPTSYKCSSIKIALSALILSLLFVRDEIAMLFNFNLSEFEQNNRLLSILGVGVVGVATILCIYIAACEIFILLEKDNYTSYFVPIITLIVFWILLVCLLLVKDFFELSNVLIIVVSICLGVMGWLCGVGTFLYVTIFFRISHTRSLEAQTNISIKPNDCVVKTTSELIDIVEKNDIIEIVILLDRCIIKIGASSDCKQDSFDFYDKMYYIDEEKFNTVKVFANRLEFLCKDGEIHTYSIDGGRLKN